MNEYRKVPARQMASKEAASLLSHPLAVTVDIAVSSLSLSSKVNRFLKTLIKLSFSES